jgi:hypothetical protein
VSVRQLLQFPLYRSTRAEASTAGTEAFVDHQIEPRGLDPDHESEVIRTTERRNNMTTDELRSITVTEARNMRYGEIFVIKETGIEVYNTTGLNDCPAELWDALDLEAIKEQYGALSIQKNGPHFWMMDWQELSLGEKASFGGLEARWAARAPLSAVQEGAAGAEPYKVYTPAKKQKMVYSKGKPVYELVDPDGSAYVLQARNEEFPMESLATLGDQMTLMQEGWRYRSRILSEDLALDLGPDETIYAVGDDFRQYYTRI